ncbi:MAG: Rab family GTPase [Candidatus Kariarchaeaceae archaeon]|jgi:small GTP-binding protein
MTAANYFLKIALCGDGAVGKTSLRNRFMGRGFREEHLMTIGADFATHDVEIDSNKVTFQLWDLAGQDTFRSVRARFFRGAMGGILIYDVTRRQSFLNLTRWIEELWRNSGRGVVPIIILGNKADLRDSNSVQVDQGIKYVEALTQKTRAQGFNVHHMETSAKTGLNVNEAFNQIGRQIIDGLSRGTIKLK